MKFNDKQSKLFKNAKKFVYVSAITGVLLTGTQVGQYASTYTAHADDTTTQDNNIATIFIDQFGNRIYGTYYSINKSATNASSKGIADSLRSNGVDVKNMPATFDLTSQHTYKLPQPTHKLTVNLVDQNNKIVQTKTVDQVTNYGQTDLKDLITWAQSNGYGYKSFPSAVDNKETTVNISVIEPTTTVVNHTTQQQTSSTIETNTNTNTNTESTQSDSNTNTNTNTAQSDSNTVTTQSDSNTKVQTVSNENEKSSTQSSASNHDEKTSSSVSESSNSVEKSGASTKQSSSASENVKSEADSSAVSSSASTSSESSAQSSTSTSSESSAQSSTSTQSTKSDEKVSKSIDPVNKDVKKTGKQTSSADKKDVRAKLPQTGDKTNQSEESLLGVMTIALSAVLAFFGLRRKNK